MLPAKNLSTALSELIKLDDSVPQTSTLQNIQNNWPNILFHLICLSGIAGTILGYIMMGRRTDTASDKFYETADPEALEDLCNSYQGRANGMTLECTPYKIAGDVLNDGASGFSYAFLEHCCFNPITYNPCSQETYYFWRAAEDSCIDWNKTKIKEITLITAACVIGVIYLSLVYCMMRQKKNHHETPVLNLGTPGESNTVTLNAKLKSQLPALLESLLECIDMETTTNTHIKLVGLAQKVLTIVKRDNTVISPEEAQQMRDLFASAREIQQSSHSHGLTSCLNWLRQIKGSVNTSELQIQFAKKTNAKTYQTLT